MATQMQSQFQSELSASANAILNRAIGAVGAWLSVYENLVSLNGQSAEAITQTLLTQVGIPKTAAPSVATLPSAPFAGLPTTSAALMGPGIPQGMGFQVPAAAGAAKPRARTTGKPTTALQSFQNFLAYYQGGEAVCAHAPRAKEANNGVCCAPAVNATGNPDPLSFRCATCTGKVGKIQQLIGQHQKGAGVVSAPTAGFNVAGVQGLPGTVAPQNLGGMPAVGFGGLPASLPSSLPVTGLPQAHLPNPPTGLPIMSGLPSQLPSSLPQAAMMGLPQTQLGMGLPASLPQGQMGANLLASLPTPFPQGQMGANLPTSLPASLPAPFPQAQLPASLPQAQLPASLPTTLPAPFPQTQLPTTLPQAQLPASLPTTLPQAQLPASLPTTLPQAALPTGIPMISPAAATSPKISASVLPASLPAPSPQSISAVIAAVEKPKFDAITNSNLQSIFFPADEKYRNLVIQETDTEAGKALVCLGRLELDDGSIVTESSAIPEDWFKANRLTEINAEDQAYLASVSIAYQYSAQE